MRYHVRYRRRAKEELDRSLEVYGEGFRKSVFNWLNYLATAAARNNSQGTADLIGFLEDGSSGFGGEGNLPEDLRMSPWWRSIRKWWAATPCQKMKALLYVLQRHQPPWECRFSIRWFHGILGTFDREVLAVYEIDHANRRVIFTKFIGLPGED